MSLIFNYHLTSDFHHVSPPPPPPPPSSPQPATSTRQPETDDFETYEVALPPNKFVQKYTEDPILERILDRRGSGSPSTSQKRVSTYNKSRRTVFNEWHRDPDGAELDTDKYESDSKCAPNSGPVWGSSLWDFYKTDLNPSKRSGKAKTSASILSAFCNEAEELGHAPRELEWADTEPEPQRREAADIVSIHEDNVDTIMLDTDGSRYCASSMEEIENGDNDVEHYNTPFHPGSYPPTCFPAPPFHPTTPKLQTRIPLHLLPEELIVHDPYHLLSGDRSKHTTPPNSNNFGLLPWPFPVDATSPTSPQEYTTHTYKLNVSHSTIDKIDKKRASLDKASSSQPESESEVLCCIFPQTTSGPTYEPLVQITVPRRPPPPKRTATAHLYLSRWHRKGEGHHSYVHEAEWEIPRAMLSEPTICHACVEEKARKIWEGQSESIEGGDGFVKSTKKLSANIVVMSESAKCWAGTAVQHGKGSNWKEREVIGDMQVKDYLPTPKAAFKVKVEYFDKLEKKIAMEVRRKQEMAQWQKQMREQHYLPLGATARMGDPRTSALAEMTEEVTARDGSVADLDSLSTNVEKSETPKSPSIIKYKGPMIKIHIGSVPWLLSGDLPCSREGHGRNTCLTLSWPGPPCSGHDQPSKLARCHPHARLPPTLKVRIAAKVSRPDDHHLEREAKNYQLFNKSLSEHWTGLNLISPVPEPTPCGAIVPAFYGYYTRVEEWNSPWSEYGYHFSPLLLLEDCGEPIVPRDLDLDDRYECAALLLRFHHLGWTHGSFYIRNIVVQRGDHADRPDEKNHEEKRFRLIDFGRSSKCDTYRRQEQREIYKTLELNADQLD
ncbi:hypothetical protein AAF712_011033 [Marasmius tenuissimus]|uniref:Protein kinase domain-containing protein n=1 Tax=Marasmius tenuissimus TaxID=585030 RepID=A0ABR2ZK97_9AGAR